MKKRKAAPIRSIFPMKINLKLLEPAIPPYWMQKRTFPLRKELPHLLGLSPSAAGLVPLSFPGPDHFQPSDPPPFNIDLT